MNRTYALVWNPCLARWDVAHEHARRRGKGAGAVLAAALLLPAMAFAAALPSGGQMVTGQGQISTPTNNQMVIDQASNKLAINWQSFDIAEGNRVTFNQPGTDAIALNRVLGADGSKIMGQLDANGRVFIVNPNGVLFGQNAQVNVGGLVASTLDLSVSDFEAGNYQFKGNGSNASVINNGRITATDGGSVALLGGTVSNNGVIVANQGTVVLAAGNAMTLDFAGDGLLNVQVNEAVVDALVENHQLIKADGGQVLLTANAGDALLKTVVNNTGVIEAQTLGEKDGKIVMLGSFDGGTVQVTGTLDASAPNGGNGGFIETSGAHVQIADSVKVTTKSADGKSGTWLIGPNDFTVAASGGDMTGTAVSQALSDNGSFIIQTASMGTAGGNGDIHINDGIAWNTSSALTLKAERDININANINSTGAGKLALEFGQGAVADGNSADYHLNQGAKVSLSAGDNFSTKLGSDGTIREYRVITELGMQGSLTGTDLQGINGNPSANYVLGAGIDATATALWNNGQGFAQLGAPWWSGFGEFSGILDGLGHEISDLTINRPGASDVGLFRILSVNSQVRNLGLVGGTIIGGTKVGGLAGVSLGNIKNVYSTGDVDGGYEVGGLVGFNYGNIISAYATGKVAGVDYIGGLVGNNSYGSTILDAYATGSVTGSNYVGGLVGHNHYNASININNGPAISNAYATGTVMGADYVGGLVGYNRSGTVSHVYATGTVVGGDYVGGLIGFNDSLDMLSDSGISHAYALGAVAGENYVGGLVGLSYGEIDNSYASGAVTGVNAIGGLAGVSTLGTVRNSYATGAVSGAYDVGGLVGAGGTILDSSATGSVTGSGNFVGGLVGGLYSGSISNSSATGYVIGASSNVGGLAGYSSGGAINNSHATGAVTGEYMVGGLIGHSYGDINNSYATGAVIGGDDVGGLVGRYNSRTLSNVYATGAVEGQSVVGGLVGRSNYTSIINAYATGAVGGISYVGGLVGYGNDSTIRNSYAIGAVAGQYAIGGLAGANWGKISNSFYAITDRAGAGVNNSGVPTDIFGGNHLGTASTFANLTSLSTFANTGWDIDAVGGTSSVWRIYEGNSTPLLRSFLKAVTVTLENPTATSSKVYDGNIASDRFNYVTDQPGVILDGIASYTSASANVGSYSVRDGTLRYGLFSDQQGYDIKVVGDPSLTITPKALTLSGLTANDKVYDGNTVATLSGGSLNGLVGDETLSLSGLVGTFADKQSGISKIVTVTGGLGDGSGLVSNYSFTNPTGLTANIDRANLTVTANNANKTYDGLAFSGGNGVTYSGFVNGESESVLVGTLSYDGTAQDAINAGTYVLSASGLSADNYALSYTDGSLIIDKAALTIAANDASKVAGQSILLNGYTANGLLSDDSVASVNLSSAGEPTSAAAGNYAIIASDAVGTGLGNYAITYQDGTLQVIPAPVDPVDPSQVNTSQPYLGVLAFNGQNSPIQYLPARNEEPANEPEATNTQLLDTNPNDERLNVRVFSRGIRLPEGI
ncbi:GLUG motif-containing protein [Stutzerimonas stutzeri]|uniref:GLUG motif-containing protein n=1 Tax=Stutzerimonas stutzeri TaxID=316 RepID=UPI0002F927A9|nr:GLUG motif-containing protein [Stutzerimonas stutzeri]